MVSTGIECGSARSRARNGLTSCWRACTSCAMERSSSAFGRCLPIVQASILSQLVSACILAEQWYHPRRTILSHIWPFCGLHTVWCSSPSARLLVAGMDVSARAIFRPHFTQLCLQCQPHVHLPVCIPPRSCSSCATSLLWTGDGAAQRSAHRRGRCDLVS